MASPLQLSVCRLTLSGQGLMFPHLKEGDKATVFISEQSFLLNIWSYSFCVGHDFIPNNLLFPKLCTKCGSVLLH